MFFSKRHYKPIFSTNGVFSLSKLYKTPPIAAKNIAKTSKINKCIYIYIIYIHICICIYIYIERLYTCFIA